MALQDDISSALSAYPGALPEKEKAFYQAGVSTKKYTGQSYIGLVATNGKVPTTFKNSNVAYNARSLHTARVATNQIGLAFANWYAGGGFEFGAGGPATIQASIEYGGVVYPVTFGGVATGTALDFTTLASDLVTLPITIPAGANFFVKENRTYQAGGNIVCSDNGSIQINTAGGECFEYGITVTNRVGTAGTFTSTGTAFSRPIAVFGPTTQPSYGIVGDSRAEGFGDTASGNPDVGEIARSVGPKRAYTNVALYGESAQQFNITINRLAVLKKWCTHIICNYGVNDIFGSNEDYAATMSQVFAIRRALSEMYFYQTIPIGETSSTDSWATVANQTTLNATYEGRRKYYANYLRQTIAPFDGTFDTCSLVESSQNSGLWKAPGYTIDGVHGTAVANAAIAASGIIVVV